MKREMKSASVESYIYVLCEPDGETIRYVGWTMNLKRRFRSHIYEAKRRRYITHKNNWIFSLLQRGEQPVMKQIDAIPPYGDRSTAEQKWIAHFRSLGCELTNGTDGGEGTPGLVLSEDAKKKISDSQCLTADEIAGLHELWNAGYSYYHIEEITGINRGTAKKYIGANGRRYTDTTRKRIRDGQVGKRPPTNEERERQVAGQLASWGRRRLPDGWTEERIASYLLEKFLAIGSLARVAEIANVEIGTRISGRVVRRLIGYDSLDIPDKCINKRGKRRSEESRKKQSEARKRFWERKKSSLTETA